MKNVRWTDNACTVGGTCIHGFFNGDDLKKLFELCPSGHFTPTFYAEKFYRSGCTLKDVDDMKKVPWGYPKSTLYDSEADYYFTFMECDGQKLLEFFKESFPMVRENRRLT